MIIRGKSNISLFQVRQVTQSLYFEIRKSGMKIKVDFTKREHAYIY